MCSQASYVFVFVYAGRHPLVSLNVFECVVKLAMSLSLCMLGDTHWFV